MPENVASLEALTDTVFVHPTMMLQLASPALDTAVFAQPMHLVHAALQLLPTFTEDPVVAGRVYGATDGSTHMLPSAVVARRRQDKPWPAVFIERQADEWVLRVAFDLLRPADAPPDASSLPLTNPTVHLIAANGATSIPFETVELRPPPAWAPEVVQQILAQTTINVNQVLPILQNDQTAWFDVRANLSYNVQGQPSTIDLAALAEQATWEGGRLVDAHNGVDNEALPWQGDDGDSRGFVRLDPMVLEDGVWRPRVLRTHPKWQDFGYVKGWLPWGPLPPGARFEADIGFVSGGVHTDGVTFWVWVHHLVDGRQQWTPVVQHFKGYTGSVEFISADLSAYAGQSISIELRVDSGASSAQDWAAWVEPRIVAPPQVELQSRNPQLSSHQATGACFPPANRDNRPIYVQTSGASIDVDFDADWVQTPHGDIKESGISSQFYVLPDEYGLGFNKAQSQPAITVLLIPPTDNAGYMVRVRFGIVPSLDAKRMESMREWARGAPLAIPYAQLLLGGYERATFQPSQLFADLGLTFLGDEQNRPIDTRGFELILDCTMESYTLLTHMFTRNAKEVWIGDVVLWIRPDGAQPTEAQRTVPVWLRLDRPATHPLEVQPSPDEARTPGSPTLVVRNPSTIRASAKVHPTLLVLDPMTSDPVQAMPARPQPVQIDAAAEQRIELVPQDETHAAGQWGNVAVSLADVRLELDSDAVLSHANELASTAHIKTTVEVSSYFLAHKDEFPNTFGDVYGINVQLQRGTAEPVTVSLTEEKPKATADIAFSLVDILQGLRPEQPTFQHRRQNLVSTGAGPWSNWETFTGRELLVAPNDVPRGRIRAGPHATLRAEPSKDSQQRRLLAAGTEHPTDGYTDQGQEVGGSRRWYHLAAPNEGWVHSSGGTYMEAV